MLPTAWVLGHVYSGSEVEKGIGKDNFPVTASFILLFGTAGGSLTTCDWGTLS